MRLAHQNASSAKASRMKELDELRNRHNQKKPRFGEAETTPVGNASPRSETPEPPPSQVNIQNHDCDDHGTIRMRFRIELFKVTDRNQQFGM